MSTAVPRLVALAALLAAAGCSSSQLEDVGNTSSATSGQVKKPPVEMGGRWVLAASGRGQCGMIFAGLRGAVEGTIAPEGGCPGSFYTSRKWTYEKTGLVIRDHNGEPLAQLSHASDTRFDGKASSGEEIALTR